MEVSMQRAHRTGLVVLAALIAAAAIALGSTHHLSFTAAKFFGTAGGGSGLTTRPGPNRDAAVRGIILALTRNRVTLRRRNGFAALAQ
jgi:hypothetical protein